MADSIAQNGVLQPILVRRNGTGWELIAGERRLRAARIAGLREIPCLVLERDEREAALLGLLENLQRQDLNCFEEAEGIRRLLAVTGMTQEEAAGRLGMSQSSLANKLRLLRLSEEIRQSILQSGLSERHARALLAAQEERRAELLGEIVQKGLNVRQSEELIGQDATAQTSGRIRTPVIRDVRLFLNTLSKAVQTMKRSGVAVQSRSEETETAIEYHIVIPKTS